MRELKRTAARRYDGQTPDPSRPGASLPSVRYWQAWNKPNLGFYLTPQWNRVDGHWSPRSPALYRNLLNAFYASVKRVSESNFVVSARTAPYGDPPGGDRILAFDRALFCLQGAGLRPTMCPHPVHLDALSHQPYALGGPLWHPYYPDEVVVIDFYKLGRVLRAAEKAGHVLLYGPKRLWVTELAWDSNPPDPSGFPIAMQARWAELASLRPSRRGPLR